MIDDQVVDRAAVQFALDVLEEAAAEALLHGVHERHLVAQEQVGVIRYAVGQRPEALESGRRAVVHAHVADAGFDFRNIHLCSVFCVPAKIRFFPVSAAHEAENRFSGPASVSISQRRPPGISF